jgi:hypothetical protein
MGYAFIVWIVITRILIIGMVAMATYEIMGAEGKGSFGSDDETAISFSIFSLFALEFILAAVVLFGGIYYISQGIKWGFYMLGMLLTQTWNIITGKTE